MKTKLPVSIIAFLAIVFLFMVNCSDPDEVTGPAKTTGSGTISGKVLDEDGNALAGVNVECRGISTVSADDGAFELLDVPAATEQLVNFTKQTYSRNQKKVAVRDGKSSYCEACLYKVGHSEEFHSSGAVNVNLTASRVSVELKADGLVYEDGTAFSGNAKMELTYFSPEKENFFEAFPGDFIGVEKDGNEVPIESYGFIDVNVYDGDKKLQLAEGKPATLTMPIPANKIDEAPETMPLWYYDTLSGKWIEYGVAVKQGDQYVGDVPHFSTINLDMKMDETCSVKGIVVDKNDNPIDMAYVTLKGIDFNKSATGPTDYNGNFKFINVKSNASIQVYAEYDGIKSDIISETTPGNDEVLDLGKIYIDIDRKTCNVNGKVVFQNNVPTDNVTIKIDFIDYGTQKTIEANSNGEFSFTVLSGNNLELTAYYSYLHSETIEFEVPYEDNYYCGELFIDLIYHICKIKGRVMDNFGAPVKEADVTCNGKTFYFNKTTQTDENGCYELDSILTSYPFTLQASLTSIKSELVDIDAIVDVTQYDAGDIVLQVGLDANIWQKMGIIEEQVIDFNFINENKGWAVSSNKIFYTQDGGRNWSEQFDATTVNIYEHLWKIRFVNDNFGWACGDDLYYTTNGGANWQNMNFDDTFYFADAFFIDENKGWMTGSYTYKTSDGGKNWIPVSVDSKSNYFYEVFMVDDNNLMLFSQGIVKHTTDGGITWTEQSMPSSYSYSDFEFADNDNGWLINGISTYHTGNGGVDWVVQNKATLNLKDLCCVNNQCVYSAGLGGNIYKTLDGGNGWTIIQVGLQFTINKIHFISKNKGWIMASGNDKSMFYYTETGAE